MIKRRFYRAEHGEKDDATSDSSSSSSSSDESEDEPQVSDNDDDVQDDAHDQANADVDGDDDEDKDDSSAFKAQYPSSGYESEDSSGNELEADITGLIRRDDDSESESDGDLLNDGPGPVKENVGIIKTRPEDESVTEKVPSCVLKSKGVFKCRLCPKIVCLNEESLEAHLKSKRHARSEKLLKDGRLKRFLNSDGEEEVVTDDDDGETHAERHARIVALAQTPDLPKKARGRQRQRERLKRNKQKNTADIPNLGQQKENRAKRRRKNVD